MRYARTMSLTVFTVLMGLIGFAAGPNEKGKKDETPRPAEKEVIQSFPSNEAMKTAWKVQWGTVNGYGLHIRNAWFKRGPKDPWLQVLGDARLSEMFVPYHSGTPRFWDISYNFALVPLTKVDAGPHGKLIGDPPTVVQEVRDRGLMWIHPSTGSRRGEKLLLWGVIDAANYRYITEYGFQDDGVITFRVGSTGRNYSTAEFEGHMHNGLWRVDINLDGPANNSVYVVEHIEPDGEGVKAKTVTRPFNKGIEGSEDWNAAKFTTLNITNDKKKNARKMPISYDVVPLRMGNARHFGPDEQCTQHDFWVTVRRENEMEYPKVHEYVKKGAPIMNADVVLWHSTPGHHNPRSEDGQFRDGTFVGATPIMWTGFDLRPRNVFDGTPHFAY